MEERKVPIVVEQQLNANAAEVWKAITSQPEMIQWFFEEIPEFRAEEGFETRFTVDTGERKFEHLWKITAVERGRMIKYHWSYSEYPGAGMVVFEIAANEGGTRIRLTNEGLHTFPEEVPEFSRANCEGGWQYFIQDRLRKYFAN